MGRDRRALRGRGRRRRAARSRERRTFAVEGHHYALVHVTRAPEPDAADAVRGRARRRARCGREPDSRSRRASLRTHASDGHGADRVRLLPRRRAARAAVQPAQGRGPATAARSTRCARSRCAWREPTREDWPHALLLLGDQVYADEVSPDARVHPQRRDIAEPPARRSPTSRSTRSSTAQSWGEPVIRWLLSTVPSAMIFDDHDVHDDWNTSMEWVEEMRASRLVATSGSSAAS